MLSRFALLLAGIVPALALADNVLHPGTPVFDRPTLTALGVQLPITGDDNFNASVTVRYKKTGTTTWNTGMPLYRVHPETTLPHVIAPQFAGSILDLRPSTSYDVELHIKDPDGLVDQTTTITGSTRALPSDPTSPRIVNVTNADSFNAALGAAQPGDIINLANGTYVGQFGLYRGGTASNPIVIRGASEEGVILDGDDCWGCNVLELYGSYIHVERMTVQNAERAVRFQTSGAQANSVRYVHIKNTTLGIGSKNNQADFYIADNILEGRISWPQVYWDNGGARSDDDGIHVEGSGHVIAYNRISGYGDAMKTAQDGARSIDFYGNDIVFTYDNGVELDGGEGNIRCMRNRFTNTFGAISAQPIVGGPAYIIRNEAVNTVDEQVKLHAHANPLTEPNGVFVYHNTFLSNQFALNMQASAAVHHFVIENNLFIGPPDNYENDTVDWWSVIDDGIFDYNGYWPNLYFSFLTKSGLLKVWQLTGLQQAGMETHGTIVGDANGPTAFAGGQTAPLDYTIKVLPQDLTLAANSPALNRGLVVPNVNDGFNGSAPDLGAREVGCPAPTFGPRQAGVDETNQTVGCTSGGGGGGGVTPNPPAVAINAPLPAATVSGAAVSLSATATASSGLTISTVQFKLDSTNLVLGTSGAQNTYTATFDSTKFTNGNHTLTAVAVDSATASTTSSAVTINISNTVTPPPPTPGAPTRLLTSFATASPNNLFSGWVGMQFTVGNNPISVTSLGRMYVPGNNGTHALKLVRASDQTEVPGGTVQVAVATGTPEMITYAALASPVLLPANTSYYLVSQETMGGDYWRGLAGVSGATVAVINGPVYWDGSSGYNVLGFPGSSFVPVNLLYTAATTTAPPAVNVIAPAANAKVSGFNVTVSATATAATGLYIANVQFKLDGSNLGLGTPGGGNSYGVALDSTKYLNGTHTVTATATDSAGGVTTSQPLTFTIDNSAPPVVSGTSYITSFTPGMPNNNFNGWVGMRLNVGANPITVTALGRVFIPGNIGVHAVKFVRANDSTDLPGGSASVAVASGSPNAFTYAQLATPVTLAANTAYYLVSFETGGGDMWYSTTSVTSTNIATATGLAYSDGAGKFAAINAPGSAFVPVSFLYSTGPAPFPPSVNITIPASNATVTGTSVSMTATATAVTPLSIVSLQFKLDGTTVATGVAGGSNSFSGTFDSTKFSNGAHSLTATVTDSGGSTATSTAVPILVSNPNPGGTPLITSFSSGPLRNNFPGWVGMQFTVGSSPLKVASVGRIFVAGNTASHVVKLVRASDGADVPGGSASVAVATGSPNTFTYTQLPSPITLAANTTYYLVSEEVSGGDQWHDHAQVTPTSAAVVNAPIYWDGTKWIAMANTGSSFVPVNLVYSLGTAAPPAATINITSPPANAVLSGAYNSIVATVSIGNGLTVTSLVFKVDGTDVAQGVSSPTSGGYSMLLDTTKFSNGAHTLTAVATDSSGGLSPSAPLPVTFSN